MKEKNEDWTCPCGMPEVIGHGWCEECLPFIVSESK